MNSQFCIKRLQWKGLAMKLECIFFRYWPYSSCKGSVMISMIIEELYIISSLIFDLFFYHSSYPQMQRYAIWRSLGQAQGRSKLGKCWVIFKWKRSSNGKNHALYYCTYLTIAVQLSSQGSKPLRTYWACHSIWWVTWPKRMAVSDIWKTSCTSCTYATLCVWVGGDVASSLSSISFRSFWYYFVMLPLCPILVINICFCAFVVFFWNGKSIIYATKIIAIVSDKEFGYGLLIN